MDIGGISLIRQCIASCIKFAGSRITVLATSDREADDLLVEHCADMPIEIFRGDPVNVANRIYSAAKEHEIDTIFRVTGDCPFHSAEIAEILLKSHLSSKSDYSSTERAAQGTGLEIFNTESLGIIIENFPSLEYSEFLTFFFTNNPELFSLNRVILPERLIRDYRLTVDYMEDIELMNELCLSMKGKNLEFNMQNAFNILDENNELAEINENRRQVYVEDEDLFNRILLQTKMRKTQ